MKMRKLVLMAISIAMSCNECVANEGNVTLYNDDKQGCNGGNNTEIPVVNYDDNEVTIISMCVIEDAFVVIRDAEGNVVAEEQMVLSPTESTISVPEGYADDGCTIEMSYGRNNLYGYLNMIVRKITYA